MQIKLLKTYKSLEPCVRGETQIFRQFEFRQHFAKFTQNASLGANGEI
jgi:hypothetical protein